jgi:hypothetical protein
MGSVLARKGDCNRRVTIASAWGQLVRMSLGMAAGGLNLACGMLPLLSALIV